MRGRGLRRCLVAGLLVCAGWMGVPGPAMLTAQALRFEAVGSIPGPVEAMRVDGTRAYVASGRTLTIFDVSNPAAPKRLGAYTFPEQVWSFRVSGTTAWIGVNFSGLAILDVSNASAPMLRGSFKTPGQAKAAAVVGAKVLVVDHMEGLVLVDVSNPAKPAGLGSFFVDGYARDVVASGSYAYGVDSPTGLYIFDLSKAGPPEPLVSLQTGNALRSVEVSERGNLIVAVGGGSLQPYDVSNPAAPVQVPPYRTPGGAQRVALRGALAYVADGREGLQVVDLAQPAAPRVVGSYKTERIARDVAVGDSIVLVAQGGPKEKQDVLILRQTP